MRKSAQPAVDNSAFAMPAGTAAPYQTHSDQTQPVYGTSTVVSQPVYSSDGYYSSRMPPVYVRQQEIAAPVIVRQEPETTGTHRVYQEQEYYTDSRGHRRGRTKTHSVEIVAGTAAAGAVIGALAGGGKGAAIGAVSGGGAGLVYDRLTHNK